MSKTVKIIDTPVERARKFSRYVRDSAASAREQIDGAISDIDDLAREQADDMEQAADVIDALITEITDMEAAQRQRESGA